MPWFDERLNLESKGNREVQYCTKSRGWCLFIWTVGIAIKRYDDMQRGGNGKQDKKFHLGCHLR